MAFAGFGKHTIEFLSGLGANNEKDWFDTHRKDYEEAYLQPAEELLIALAPRLKKIDPEVEVEPRVNGSIMRINRDIRFSKDKKPYKDHLDLWMWTGERKGWDSSGFFFRLTPDRLILGAGMHAFEPARLARYRKAVLDPKKGPALARIVATLRKAGYTIGSEKYKKLPTGVPADHVRAALLRHGALHATWEGKHPAALKSAAFVGFVADHFRKIAPIHAWLRAM
jgi:uncharacterized protein (TIGR02453 family)